MPHMPPPHMPPPHGPVSHMPFPHPAAGADFAPLSARAANVEYSFVTLACPQEGQSTAPFSVLRRTSFSNFVPQSSQVYSKIGIQIQPAASKLPKPGPPSRAAGTGRSFIRIPLSPRNFQRLWNEVQFEQCRRGYRNESYPPRRRPYV